MLIWHTLLIGRCSIVMHADDLAWLGDQIRHRSCVMIRLAVLSNRCRSCMLHADLAFLADRLSCKQIWLGLLIKSGIDHAS
jgi:hypothetical protein